MNPRLPEYIVSSVVRYLKEVNPDGLQFYVEGIDEPTTEAFTKDSALVRVTGPVVFNGNLFAEWYGIEIQVLLTDLIHRPTENAYNIYHWSGIFLEALNSPLPIFDTSGEEDVLIGCLQPDKRQRQNIRVVNFNMVDTNLPVRQMAVIGKFILFP